MIMFTAPVKTAFKILGIALALTLPIGASLLLHKQMIRSHLSSHSDLVEQKADYIKDQISEMRMRSIRMAYFIDELEQFTELALEYDSTNNLPDDFEKLPAAHIARSLLNTNTDIFQLRLIAIKDGIEILRAERKNNSVTVRNRDELQNKSDTGYFKKARSLAENQIYITPIELNREYGRISYPQWRTMRVLTPIYRKNKALALVVLNVNLEPIFNQISEIDQNLNTTTYVLDHQGHFIHHPNQIFPIGKELNNTPQSWPTLFSKINRVKGTSLDFWYNSSQNEFFYIYQTSLAAADRNREYEIKLNIAINKDTIYKRVKTAFIAIDLLCGLLSLLIISIWYLISRYIHQLKSLLSKSSIFHQIFDNSDDPIIITNRSYEVERWNRQAASLFSGSKGIYKNVNIETLLNCIYNNLEIFRSNNEKGKYVIKAFELSVNSQVRHYDILISDIRLNDASPGFCFILKDVSEELETIRDLNQDNIELEQVIKQHTQLLQEEKQKLEAVNTMQTRFIYSLSHEIRTPLNGVLGSLRLLRPLIVNSHSYKIFEMAENSAKTLNELLINLLDISKIESGQLDFLHSNFNAIKLFSNCAEKFSSTHKNRNLDIILDFHLLQNEWHIGDRDRIEQLTNALLNHLAKHCHEAEVIVKVKDAQSGKKADLNINFDIAPWGGHLLNISALKAGLEDQDLSNIDVTLAKKLLLSMQGSIKILEASENHLELSCHVPTNLNHKLGASFSSLGDKQLNCLVASSSSNLANSLENLLIRWGVSSRIFDLNQQPSLNKSHFDLIFIDAVLPPKAQAQLIDHCRQNDTTLAVIIQNRQLDFRPPSDFIFVEVQRPVTPSALWKILVNSSSDSSYFLSEDNSRDIEDPCILVVDDNDVNLEVLSRIVEDLKLPSLVANSGNKAIESLKSNPNISLILMDIQMPGMDGFETTRKIREGSGGNQHSSIPIVAVTANAVSGIRERCISSGMNGYLTKPVMIEDVDAVINEFILNRKSSSTATKPYNAAQNNSATKIQSETFVSSAQVETRKNQPENELPVWDLADLNKLLKGREDRIVKLVSMFLDTFSDELKFVNSTYQKYKESAQNDANRDDLLASLRDTVHSIKGSASNLRASSVASKAKEIELAIDDRNAIAVGKHLELLNREAIKTQAAMSDFVSAHQQQASTKS